MESKDLFKRKKKRSSKEKKIKCDITQEIKMVRTFNLGKLDEWGAIVKHQTEMY